MKRYTRTRVCTRIYAWYSMCYGDMLKGGTLSSNHAHSIVLTQQSYHMTVTCRDIDASEFALRGNCSTVCLDSHGWYRAASLCSSSPSLRILPAASRCPRRHVSLWRLPRSQQSWHRPFSTERVSWSHTVHCIVLVLSPKAVQWSIDWALFISVKFWHYIKSFKWLYISRRG